MLLQDGFASLDVTEGSHSGQLTTRVLQWPAAERHLFVNHVATNLRAEVLTADGKPIPPFTLANCAPLSGDSTRQELTWSGAKDGLAAVAGQPVRLRFELESGQLFSFWTAPSKCGASSGYLSSGAGLVRGRDMHGSCV